MSYKTHYQFLLCTLFLTSFLSQSVIEEAISHHSFDDSLELVDTCSYCVALYDYNKVNPNDVQLRWVQ